MTSSDRARAAAGVEGQNTPGTEVAVSGRDRRIALIDKHAETFAKAAPRGAEATLILRDAQNAIRQIPELAECTPESLLGALMTATQLGLRPNVGALGHGWILPFRNNNAGTVEAQWILGYRGMIELGTRSGKIASIVARTIYENEKYLVRYGLDEALEHTPVLNGERGRPVLHYAIARFTNGGSVWIVIDETMVEEAKKRSKGSKNTRSPWNTDREAMARKTAIRQLARFFPTASELNFAIHADETVRTDLSTEALGYTIADGRDDGDGEQRQTTASKVVEGTVVEPDSGGEPPAAEPAEAKVRKYNATALRKGLIQAIEQRSGAFLVDAVLEVVGDEVARAANIAAGGDVVAMLDYVGTDDLRAIREVDLAPFVADAASRRTVGDPPIEAPPSAQPTDPDEEPSPVAVEGEDGGDETRPVDGGVDPDSDLPDPNG